MSTKSLGKQSKELLNKNNALKEEVTSSKDDVNSLLQIVSNLRKKLTTSEKEKEKTLLQNKKLLEDIAIVEDVKRIESFKDENDTLTKVLNRTFEGSDKLKLLLKDNRHLFEK